KINGEAQTINQTSELFKNTELLYLYVTADFQNILDNRKEKPRYFPAKLEYYNDSCKKIALNISIRNRGNFRLDKEHCDFPPLKLNFKKSNISETLFTEQKTLKLVTHCKENKYVLREYILYNIYSIITDKSYKTRLAQIQYIDTGSHNDTTIYYAFILENTKKMAQRCGGEIIKNTDVTKDNLDLNYTTLLYLFEFMIGNSDWDISLNKNVKFLSLSWYDKLIPVPYDFDWAEIVDAQYTNVDSYNGNVPISRKKLKNIERTDKQFQVAFSFLINKKDEIYKFINDFQYLSYTETNDIIKYLDSFYDIIEKKNLTKEKFLELIEKENAKLNKQKLKEQKKKLNK
ncbi:MAG: hypothetical protein GXO79_14245, partial [Chlorobi bacterium]|nr:hypothetical protein [Chlorobiota bacterium]